MHAVTTNTLEQNFGERLASARGDLSMAEVVYRVRRLLNGYSLSVATISRYESGATSEDRTDPVVVWALAKVLGVPLADMSPRVAELVALLGAGRSGCSGTPADAGSFLATAA